MYHVEERSGSPAVESPRTWWHTRRAAATPAVLALGATSLVTDISSEMVTSVLPLYLVLHLQYSPVVFGAVDGLYQGGAAVSRLLGGLAADRTARHRDVAAAGYALSALSRILFLVVGRQTAGLIAVMGLDRVAKGLRTAPRDALISFNAAPNHVAAAFGVHRAMDTAGAALGPLVTFAILATLPRAYDVVFVTSFAIGIVGVGVLLTLVDNPPRLRAADPTPTRTSVSPTRPGQRALVLAAALLGLVTIGDGLLYLALRQRVQFDETYLPLLFVATPAVFMLLAIPAGRAADRWGQPRVVLLGYALLGGAYVAALAGPRHLVTLWVSIVLLGAYYAATDGVLMALASRLWPEGERAAGLALVATTTGVARVASGVCFGWLWATASIERALSVYSIGLVLAVAASIPLIASLGRGDTAPDHATSDHAD